ncbi:MAG: ABC transporter ATP-binding protein [Candidatus Dojkabacteria bacterium]|jgi:ABC-2 type transport system ATP-binding protein
MASYSISVKNFSKSFGSLKAVDDFSFNVNEGEIFAFLGSNGSGKTTTIRCLLKIYLPDEGELLINGKEYTEKLNRVIGYLPEERGIYKGTKALDILVYTGVLRGMSTEEAKKKSLEYLDYVGLIEAKDKEVSKLSSGMQQKVQLGVALIHKPEILILDEPFRGLDPVNRQMFVDILLQRKKEGATILYSTHVIDEAQKMADSLVIVNKGKMLEHGSINEVRKRHGSSNIVVEFDGERPLEKGKLYTSVIDGKNAEIKPNSEDIDSNDILKELVDNGTKIINMKLDYPSLNQIFIDLMKKS